MKDFSNTILESIATGVVTFDTALHLTSVNRAGSKIFGFTMRGRSQESISSLIDSKTNPRLYSIAESVLTTQRRRTVFDVRFLRADKVSLSLNVTALPLQENGNLLGGLLAVEDITQEQRFANTLCRYLAREVAEQVLQDQEKSKLGGMRTEVTILIVDIRNFTTLSERMEPDEIMAVLNTYFPRMINVIFRHQGMVDKLIGDAILAVFGVPTRRDDDALRAVQTALQMRKELVVINKELVQKWALSLEIGIGITSGIVISGNIGSERRMDFTVIGDPVNLAARLEGLTRELGHRILVSESVRDAVAGRIPCEAVGLFPIKGKTERVPVFGVSTS